MEDKDKIIASLRKQLKDALSRCNALEQENALLSYQLEKGNEEMSGITFKNRQGANLPLSLRDYGIAPVFSWIKGMQEALFGKADGRRCFPVPE